MSNSTIGLIIGGFIPAILYAGAGLFSKVSTKTGIGMGPYLVMIGIAIVIVGLIFSAINQNWAFTNKGALVGLGAGLTWGIGTGLFALALSKYGTPVSQLTPLYNMNTLLVVLIGLIVFAEYKDVEIVKLSTGTVMIVVGGILVSLA